MTGPQANRLKNIDPRALMPTMTAEMLYADNVMLTMEEAKIIAETVPLRGTDAWRVRETLRRRIGCRCIGA